MPTKKKSQRPNADQPWISNYPPLKAWLDKIGAMCGQQVPLGDPEEPRAYFELWSVTGGKSFMLIVFANRNGWEIYTPVYTNKVAETLADAEKRLGIEPEVKPSPP